MSHDIGSIFCMMLEDEQFAAMGDDGCPNVCMGIATTDVPALHEQLDVSVESDLANEVDAAGANGQRVGDARNIGIGQKSGDGTATDWRLIEMRVFIPIHEIRTAFDDMVERTEDLAFPAGAPPRAVHTFDMAVALWFAHGDEERLAAQIQHQVCRWAERISRSHPHGVPRDRGSTVHRAADSQLHPTSVVG